MAALVRFSFLSEESKIDFTMDRVVLRLSEETQMADWISLIGDESGGTCLDWVKEVLHGSGN